MHWLEAFRIQLALSMALALQYCIRCLINENRKINFLENKKWWLLILFAWFVLGTWLRYYFQMPLWGPFSSK